MTTERDYLRLPLPLDDVKHCRVQALTTFKDMLLVAVVAERRDRPYERTARLLCSKTPQLESWKELYRRQLSPDFVNIEGRVQRIGLEQGFQNFVTWHRPGAARASVFIACISLKGSCILEIGEDLTVIELPNASPASGVPPLGQLLPTGDRMVGTPATQSLPDSRPRARRPAADIFATRDPGAGDWQPVCEPGFGAPTNQEVGQMAAFDGALYAATVNPTAGFELWRLRGDEPPIWQRVLRQGAFRYSINKASSAMTVFGDALYLGTMSLAPGKLQIGDHGPEIIRVEADDQWDIVVGIPRFTPDGLKVPISACGPGFGDASNGAFTQLLAETDTLVACLQCFVLESAETVAGSGDYASSATLWSSRDGIDWAEVPTKLSSKVGRIRAACSLPTGLLLAGQCALEGADDALESPLVLLLNANSPQPVA